MVGMITILQEKGNMLREPYSKYLGNGIFELRGKVGSNNTRVFILFLPQWQNNFNKRICEKDTEDTQSGTRKSKGL